MTDAASNDYWRPGELEEVGACPGCGGIPAGVEHADLADRSEHVPGRWNFLRCADCDSLFLSPRPTKEAISKAYAASYYTHESGLARNEEDNGTSVAWRLANGYLNSRYGCRRQSATRLGRWVLPLLVPIRQQLDFFYRHLPRPAGRLLDVGCGNGAFLLRAREAGWNVQGIEPDPVAAGQALAAGLSIHARDISACGAPSGGFDVVTLSHVLEHLHDPASMLASCRDLLRPGGMLWLATPNIQGVGHRAYASAWFPLEPPRHLFLSSARQLETMCRAAGFRRVRFLRRGRVGTGLVRVCAARARQLGIATLPDWLVRLLINIASVTNRKGSEEFIVVAFRDET